MDSQFKKVFYCLILIGASVFIHSENLLAQSKIPFKPEFSVYSDIYYSNDFRTSHSNEKEYFVSNYKRNSQVSLNLALIKAEYKDSSFRYNLGFMAGDYARFNLANEPEWAQFVYESNIGFKISRKYDLWLDAGIMPSHIGMETAISNKCWTLTRSVVADNSPYYQSGVKMSFTDSHKKWYAALLVLNGWQKISIDEESYAPSAGTQLTWFADSNWTINYSTFFGQIPPINNNSLRTYHNIYATYSPPNGFVQLSGGIDIGTQTKNGNKISYWLAPLVNARFNLNTKNKLAARAEYFYDPSNAIIPKKEKNGFLVYGTSLNYDYIVRPGIMVRAESRILVDPKNSGFNNFNDTHYLTLGICAGF